MHTILVFSKNINTFAKILIAMKNKCTLKSIWNFYVDGFKNMTWGRPLWGLIFLKIIILFFVLRLFFFQPTLAGKSEAEKIDIVGRELTLSK